MQHLDEGTIHAWLDGALSADEGADVERHAKECAECAALVADARGMIAGAARIVSALDVVPAGVIPQRKAPAGSGSLWRALHVTPLRAALAASLMVAAASLAVFRHAPPAVGPKADTTLAIAASPFVVDGSRSPKLATPTSNLGAEAPRTPPRSKDAVKPAAPAAAPITTPAAAENKVVASEPAELRKATAAVDSSSLRTANAAAVSAPSAAAPPAARAGLAGGATADMTQARREVAVRAVGGIAQSLSIVATSADQRPLELPGCYQFVRDSLHSSFQLPERVSFESSTDPSARNVVRSVLPDGRRDTLITGVTWRWEPGAARVVLTGNNVEPLASSSFREQTINAAGRGARGMALISPVRLTRIDCR